MQNLRSFSDQQIIDVASNLSSKIRSLDVHLIEVLVELTQREIHLNRGFSSVKAYLAIELKMSEDQAAKRSQVVNLIRHFPAFLNLLKAGQTHLSHLALCAPRITEKNEEAVLKFLPGQSKSDVLFFLSRLNADGSFKEEVEETVEIIVRSRRATLNDFERARKLVAKDWRGATNEEVLQAALSVLLEKIDPERKAKRATARAEKSERQATLGSSEQCPGASGSGSVNEAEPKVLGAARYIPQAIRHQVYLRDGGRCTFISAEGRRCDACVSLALDHICMFSRGGKNTVENLRLLCVNHNNYLAMEALGRGFMGRFVGRYVDRGLAIP